MEYQSKTLKGILTDFYVSIPLRHRFLGFFLFVTALVLVMSARPADASRFTWVAQDFYKPLSDVPIHLHFPATPTVDLIRLSHAVAAHETGNCTAKVGSARFNNCLGFRVAGHFLHFKTKEDSYAYFRSLWTRSYGGGLPTIREATAYVCGWQHLKHAGAGTPCPGGTPKSWLAEVTYFYNNTL